MQRMQHMACYSQQLVVALGEEGAGKSTLLTALVSEQEEYNSALVVCPMHADAAEIRRKILIQLLSEPLFDDEEPLGNTLGRFASALSQPIHILIDDAHLLPLELWAECLLLSQQKCAGRPIAITFACEPAKARALYAELGSAQRGLMAPIDIEPLPLGEREALYYTLISRSDDVPYVPRDIIKTQLEQQAGRPGEVITLLELALAPRTDVAVSRKGLWRVLAVAAVTLLVTAGLWGVISGHPGEINPTSKPSTTQTASTDARAYAESEGRHQATGLLSPFGEWRLKPYFANRKQALNAALQAEQEATAAALAQEQADLALLAEARALAEVETADTLKSVSVSPAAAITKSDAPVTQASTKAAKSAATQHGDVGAKPVGTKAADVRANSEMPRDPKAKGVQVTTQGVAADTKPAADAAKAAAIAVATNIQLPKQGYTLQIATVGKRESADVILKRLAKEPNLYLVLYRDKLVILQGNYSSHAEADSQADSLPQRYGGGKPWVRAWKDLGTYQPIEAVSGGEISN